ncbi:MAG: hypothetical protein HGB04_03915 [Chlorobiaceae bacterium]|nr:hypothetical protein [Chlorobiaceae bacterium]
MTEGNNSRRRIRNKLNQREGTEAQDIVERFMREQGFQRVERIETGFSVVRRGTQIVGAYPKRAVSGDIKAIGPKGKAVHVEVKHRQDVLRWSHFETHQITALDEVTEAGGWAFVAWVTSIYPARLFWLLWPIPGFRKGKGLTTETARDIEPGFFGFRNHNPM